MISLIDAKINKVYKVAQMCDDIALGERGIVPGTDIVLMKKQGGLVMFKIHGTSVFCMRYDNARCVKLTENFNV